MTSCLRHIDFLDGEIAQLDQRIARQALALPGFHRLLTIPGVDVGTAAAVIGAVGDITRFQSPGQLVAYLGLDPRVRQSGSEPARYGHISKRGDPQARAMLVEAAWRAIRTPDPCARSVSACARAAARRSPPSRSLASCWYSAGTCSPRKQDYAFARPSLTRQKTRRLELPPAPHRCRAVTTDPRSRRRAASARPRRHSKRRPSTPTGGSSPTGARQHREEVRARHRGAHLKGPRRAKPRSRPQAPDTCTSLRQSPAPATSSHSPDTTRSARPGTLRAVQLRAAAARCTEKLPVQTRCTPPGAVRLLCRPSATSSVKQHPQQSRRNVRTNP